MADLTSEKFNHLANEDNKLLEVQCPICSFKTIQKPLMKLHLENHQTIKVYSCPTCNKLMNTKNELSLHMKSHLKLKSFKCIVCGQELDSKANYKLHMCTHDDITFKCSHCNYQTKVRKYLIKHVQRHFKRYQCYSCSFVSPDLCSLKKHLKTHSSEKIYRCNLCDYVTAVNSDLRRHVLRKHDNKEFKCSQCSYQTLHKKNLQIHMNKHEKQRKFVCSFCDFQTKWEICITNHISCKHSDRKVLKCRICNYKTSTTRNYIFHLKTHTANMFTCLKCSYGTTSKFFLEKHLLSHQDTNLLKCKDCMYESKSRKKLNSHVKQIHSSNKKNYTCDKCNFSTVYKCALRKHILGHNNKLSYICPASGCNYRSNFKVSTDNHFKNKHTDGQKNVCPNPQCNFETKSKYYMKSHILTSHKSVKPYKCDQYKNALPQDLVQKRKIHGGLKPLICTPCNKQFASKSSLAMHILRHQKGDLFKCNQCEFGCRSKITLQKHTLTHSSKIEFTSFGI